MKYSALSLALAAVLLLSSITTDTVDAACAGIKIRRELRELSTEQRVAYFNAIKQLQSGPQPNKYDELVNYHTTFAPVAHGVPAFLPWHRVFLNNFQIRINAIDPSVVIPYWDWGADSQAPEQSPVFSPQWYGGNGVGPDNCVQDGFFKDYKCYYPTPGSCFSRKFDGLDGKTIGALYSADSVAKIQSDSKDYDTYRRAYEATVHARVHNSIGSSFSRMVSPSDAIFFVHHALVDKHWAEWQALGHATDFGPIPDSTVLQPWAVTVASTFDTQADPFCYTYSNLNALAAKQLAPDASGAKDTGDQGASLVRRNYVEPRPASYVSSTPAAPADNDDYDDDEAQCEQDEDDEKPKQTGSDDYLLPHYSDRQDLLSLRVPNQVPNYWIKMNNLNETDVRRYEADNSNFTRALNKVPGYISSCAIFNRPDILAKLVNTTNDFIGYVGSQKLHFNASCTTDPIKAAEEIIGKVLQFVKTSPDVDELSKVVSPDTLKLIKGYGGGISVANLTYKLEDVYDSSKNVSDLVSKFTAALH